jgi:hypothetical protein
MLVVSLFLFGYYVDLRLHMQKPLPTSTTTGLVKVDRTPFPCQYRTDFVPFPAEAIRRTNDLQERSH